MKKKLSGVLGLTLVAGGLLAASRPAHADWQFVRFEFSTGAGTETEEDAYSFYPSTHSGTAANKVLWATSGDPTGSIDPRGSAGYTQAKGQVRSVFQYVPRQVGGAPDPTDTVPDYLTLKISASASAKAQDQPIDRVPDPGSTDHAYYGYPIDYFHTSGSEHVAVSLRGKTAPVVVGANNTSATISIKDLVKVPTNGASEVAGPWCDIDAKGNIDGNRFDEPFPNVYSYYKIAITGHTEAGATYDAAVDDRSVKLTRGGRYEHSELENGEWHTYDDSIYSAHNVDGIPDALNLLTVTANISGVWSPGLNEGYGITPVWNTAGFDSFTGETWDSRIGYTTYGTPTLHRVVPFWFDYQGNATGEHTYSTTYKATDNGDGATSTAYYHLTLHDPVEPLDEGETTTTYTVRSPMYMDSQVMAWAGPRLANDPETTIHSITSTETGYDLTATTTIEPFKDLLGFTGEGTFTSTKTLSVDTDTKVPAIPSGKMVYLIAVHTFQRTHSRFYRYDELGKIRRMVTMNSLGTVFNPPVEMYHEAFRDSAFLPNYEWSDAIQDTTLS